MKDQGNRSFSVRAFVALVAAIAGLGLPVTGVANHLHQLAPMTTARHAWMSAHNILGLLFVVFALWHAILNRRALVKHVGGLAERLPRVSREAALAALLVTVLLVAVLGHALHAGSQ
jgi:hypothetical protein